MLKPYFLTTKSNLAMAMALSFFAFMILGSINASAQWVSTSDATNLVKQEVETLENDFSQATATQERYQIAFEIRYYTRLLYNLTEGGMEVPEAVEEARPEEKPMAHSSGLVYLSAEDENFKMEAQALVDAGTDLLSF